MKIKDKEVDIKEYLKEISRLKVLISQKQEVLRMLNSQAEYKGNSYGENSGGSSGTSDRMDLLMKICDREKELDKQLDTYTSMLTEAMAYIDKLTNPLQIQVIYLRYLQSKSWAEISIETGRDLRQVFRLHGRALAELDKIVKMS